MPDTIGGRRAFMPNTIGGRRAFMPNTIVPKGTPTSGR